MEVCGSSGDLIEDHVVDGQSEGFWSSVFVPPPAMSHSAIRQNHCSANPLNLWFRRGVAWFLPSLRA
jgi:hypothetical protein